MFLNVLQLICACPIEGCREVRTRYFASVTAIRKGNITKASESRPKLTAVSSCPFVEVLIFYFKSRENMKELQFLPERYWPVDDQGEWV